MPESLSCLRIQAMLAETPEQRWIERFPGLSQLKDSTKSILLARSKLVDIAIGSRVFEPGRMPSNLLFLLEGTVRVQQTSDSGRQVVLYRARAGESCVMTNACLFAYQENTAEGIAETPVRAASISKQLFDELLSESSLFREFVFCAFSKRITDLFQVVDEIAFKRLDVRLVGKLLELEDEQGVVATTHQKMSVELGTAREVISRQLKDFQQRGWVEVSRGKVSILNRTELLGVLTKNS